MADHLLRGLRPVRLGETLRDDILPAVGHSKSEIARLLGISRQTPYDILNERQPATPAMALRLAQMFGGSAESWVRMQGAYDLKVAERNLVDAIPHLEAT